MNLARLVQALLRRARRDPVGTARTVLLRVRDEPAYVLVKADTMLADTHRRRLYPVLLGIGGTARRLLPTAVWPVLLVVFAAHGLGHDAEVDAEVAAEAGRRRRPAQRLALAALLAEIDRAPTALALVEDLPASTRVRRIRGRVRWRAGDLRAADAELSAAAADDRRPSTRRIAHRVHEDLRALDPEWRVPAPALAGPRPTPLPRRVVHLINNSLPLTQAGYTVRAHRVAAAQREVGLDPVMVTKLGYPWKQGHVGVTERVEVDGVTYRHVPDPGGERVFGTAERVERSVARLGPVVADLRPAALHPTTPFDNAQVALSLGQQLEIPVVYEVRGFLEETWRSRQPGDAGRDRDQYRLTRATEGACATRADHVVTLGRAMADDLAARGVDPDRITVVPNAVDVDEFTPGGREGDLARGAAVRRELEVPEGRALLGYISSLVSYEGVEVLLRATRELLDRGLDVGVLIVGDGAARPGWEREAEVLGLGDRCRFTGRVPHARIQAYYEAIDVFVVPRRDDRVCRLVTPLKPVEAMALEGCVVVSDLPALAEMVEEGVTGRTFTPEDPVALADVVAPLAGDPQARAALGAAAREHVAAERTWAANARRYADVYRTLGVL
ncbi:MAG: glycosyltransferase family 4 protein [Nitriliruptor sp.]